MGIEARKSRLNQVVRGWMNYFKLADAKKLIQGLDEWIRSRIRMVTWKRWKKSPHTFREPQALRNQGRTGMDVGKHKKRLLAYCP